MNQKFIFIVFLGLFFFNSCDDTIDSPEEDTMMATINIYSRKSFIDTTGYLNLYFSGTLITNPIANLKYILVDNDTIFPYIPTNITNDGTITFHNSQEEEILDLNSKYFTLVSTSGYLLGLLNFPDSISSIRYNFQDTMKISDKLIISFNGNADYHVFNIIVSTNTIRYKETQLVTKQNFLEIDSSLFKDAGGIFIFHATSVNGPYPEFGSTGNMVGNGTGFLNCIKSKEIFKLITIVE